MKLTLCTLVSRRKKATGFCLFNVKMIAQVQTHVINMYFDEKKYTVSIIFLSNNDIVPPEVISKSFFDRKKIDNVILCIISWC